VAEGREEEGIIPMEGDNLWKGGNGQFCNFGWVKEGRGKERLKEGYMCWEDILLREMGKFGQQLEGEF
jgi:hypothetical protein